jgi:hypothetical protein
MYRRIKPQSPRRLALRMLFQPAGGEGVFHRACEADSFRGLVAAILDDSGYETADAETRLVHRLRLADDVCLIAELDGRRLRVADHDRMGVINIASDELLIRSLELIGYLSLDPAISRR